jgi:WD40 repeat protein
MHVPAGLTQFTTYRDDGMLIVADDTGLHHYFDDEGRVVRTEKLDIVRSPVGVPETAGRDGHLLAIGGGDGRVTVLDTVSGARRSVSGADGGLYEISFSRDGTQLVSGGADHAIRLWDLTHGTSRVVGRHPLPVWHAVLSPDERTLASAGDDLDLRIWSLEGDAPPVVLHGHTGIVYQLAYAPDGKTVASAGLDASVRLWNPSNGSARVLLGHRGLIQVIAFSPDGKLLATGADDRTVRLWTIGTGEARVLSHGAGITHVLFLPGGAWLATGDAEGTVRVWDVARGSLRAIYRGSTAAVVDLSVRADGKRLAASTEDGAVHVWADPTDGPRPPTTADALARLGSVEIIDGEALSAARGASR